MGIATLFLAEGYNVDSIDHVIKGQYQLLFISPEFLLKNQQMRNILLSDVYQTNLVCVTIDEAHCVLMWGTQFRETYLRIGEIRSLIPSNVVLLALTATASRYTRSKVSQMLLLRHPTIVYMPPCKPNIIYYVKKKTDTNVSSLVKGLAHWLITLKCDTPKIIIYCRRFDVCSEMYLLFRYFLKEHFTNPIGAPDLAKYRVVHMYTGSCTQKEVKEHIVKSFPQSTPLRIVISTIAFSMGLDIPDVRQIIHWGASDSLEVYIQETGRAGRDGKLCCSILYYDKRDNVHLDKNMISYCVNESICRRKLLFADFEDCNDYVADCTCHCCDICMKNYRCSHLNQIKSQFYDI
jgi:superfamily II DNA helicase RecQ